MTCFPQAWKMPGKGMRAAVAVPPGMALFSTRRTEAPARAA
jgi:hypothetical protein